MTERERILTVYRGDTPDRVPFMLDLSHWFYHTEKRSWDLSRAYEEPEYDLIDLHRRLGVGFYMPNLGSFYATEYGPGIRSEVVKRPRRDGMPEITWQLTSSRGTITRRRVWEEQTYSWPVSEWGVRNERDLLVLGDALASRRYRPKWDHYRQWVERVGDNGVVYLSAGYSAMGHLLSYWMGTEAVMYATVDWPDTLHDVVDRINDNNLELVDLLAASPAEIILMGDNFSSDVQSPPFFSVWSKAYYAEAIRRLHAAGKYVAVHIDGRLRGALRMFDALGADCADAVTPKPMGDLSAAECRAEAGTRMILSGGVSPDLWLAHSKEAAFVQAVRDWLEVRRANPRLIANAGDQVPPYAVPERIRLMRDLVEAEGRY